MDRIIEVNCRMYILPKSSLFIPLSVGQTMCSSCMRLPLFATRIGSHLSFPASSPVASAAPHMMAVSGRFPPDRLHLVIVPGAC